MPSSGRSPVSTEASSQKVGKKSMDQHTLSFTLPAGLQFQKFVSVSAELGVSQKDAQTFLVAPIKEIRPGGTRTFRILATAREAGDQTLRAAAQSQRNEQPVEAFRQANVQN